MTELKLGIYGIVISWDGEDKGGASIVSELRDETSCPQYDVAADGIESVVLAHFCAGVDVKSPEYLEGLETAIDAIGNNYPDDYKEDCSDEYSDDSECCSGTVINTLIRDWRFADGFDESEILPEHRNSYKLEAEFDGRTGQLYLSVYDSNFDKHPHLSKVGLNAILEISDGLPTIRIGLSPDENKIHVVSNTSSRLAVIPESSVDTGVWGYPYFASGHKGYQFYDEDIDLFVGSREALANDAFGEYDFGGRNVEGEGWKSDSDEPFSMDSDKWWQDFTWKDNDGKHEGRFELTFAKDSTLILSAAEA